MQSAEWRLVVVPLFLLVLLKNRADATVYDGNILIPVESLFYPISQVCMSFFIQKIILVASG